MAYDGAPFSNTTRYCSLFAEDDVSLHFSTAALHAVADRAMEASTGARGLRSILEEALVEPMFHLPSWAERGVKHVVVTEKTIAGLAPPELYPPPAASEVDEPLRASHGG